MEEYVKETLGKQMKDYQTKLTVISNIVNVLVRLDNEANVPNIDPEEFARRGYAITKILNQVKNDFGEQFMLTIFLQTNKKLGHVLGPLNSTILKTFINLGFNIEVKKVVEYCKS